MATVTNIDAVLAARTSKFDGPIKNSGRVVTGFGGQVRSVGASVGASLTGMIGRAVAVGAAFLSARSAISKFNESAERLDKLAKTGDSLAATTQEMQALSRTTELAGVSTEGMTKSLKFFEVAIGKTRTGTIGMQNTAKQVFKDIGVDIDSIIDKPLTEKFATVAEALMAIESNEDRLAIGAQIFGRNILEVMPALNETRANLKDSAEFMERFGLTLSRTDVGVVEKMNDRWSDVWRVVSGIIDKVTVALSPSLVALAEEVLHVAEVALQGGKAFESITGQEGQMNLVAEIVWGISEGFKLMVIPIMQAHAGLQLIRGDLEGALETQRRINTFGMEFLTGESRERFMKRVNDARDALAKPRKPIPLIDEDMEIGKVETIAEKAAERFASVAFESPSSAATRGSSAAASAIAQINKQNSLFKELREELAKAINKSGAAVASAVTATNTILGDTNTHLRHIEDSLLLEPGSEI